MGGVSKPARGLEESLAEMDEMLRPLQQKPATRNMRAIITDIILISNSREEAVLQVALHTGNEEKLEQINNNITSEFYAAVRAEALYVPRSPNPAKPRMGTGDVGAPGQGFYGETWHYERQGLRPQHLPPAVLAQPYSLPKPRANLLQPITSKLEGKIRKISRRKFIATLGLGLGGAALAWLGLDRISETSFALPNADDYRGKVNGFTMAYLGRMVYYADVCGVANEGKPGNKADLFGVLVNKDKNYMCDADAGVASSDFAIFMMKPAETYPAEYFSKTQMTGDDILAELEFGDEIIFRKGNKISNNAWWLKMIRRT